MTETHSEAKISFEEALKRIQGAVKRLEASDVSLEESLKVYQEGIGFVKICQDHLKSAETLLAKLTPETK